MLISVLLAYTTDPTPAHLLKMYFMQFSVDILTQLMLADAFECFNFSYAFFGSGQCLHGFLGANLC